MINKRARDIWRYITSSIPKNLLNVGVPKNSQDMKAGPGPLSGDQRSAETRRGEIRPRRLSNWETSANRYAIVRIYRSPRNKHEGKGPTSRVSILGVLSILNLCLRYLYN